MDASNPVDSDTKNIDSLENLRGQIDEIDRQIVSLLAKRQEVVEQVVTLKKKHGLPVYHPAREEDLISQKRLQGAQAGINPDFIEEMYRGIIRQSREKQAKQMASQSVRPGARVLIVGGTGGMGRFFQRYFLAAGYQVRILSRKNWSQLQNLCQDVDLAIISVPIDVTEAVTRDVARHLPETAVLTDLTSIKMVPLHAMLQAHKGPVIGLHPLFGPSTSTFDKQIIVATQGRDPNACEWVLEQLTVWGGVIVRSSAQEHDEVMEIVQALRHFATFCFGQFLCRRNVDLHRTLEFSSPIYRLELGMVGRLFAQDPNLYSEIIFATPQRRQMLKEYIASLASNLEMLEKGDKSLFETEFKQIAKWFGFFSEQAMRESSFLIDKLIERF